MLKFLKKFITKPSDLWTVPNLLVYFRFILVGVFFVLYFTPISAGGDLINHYLAAGIVLLAGFTDFLDGQIARKFNKITELGKVIDPLADKLMQFAVAISLAITYYQYWIFFVMLGIFIVKEVTMLIFDIVLFRQGKKLNGAMWFGKLSTAVFYVVMGILLIFNLEDVVIYITISIATVFLFIAFVLYFPVFIRMLKESKPEKNLTDKK